MTRILPKLNDFFETDELGKGSYYRRKRSNQTPERIVTPGKTHSYPQRKPVERLWNLFQLYSMACHLMLHFRQLSHFTNLAMSEGADHPPL